MDRKSKELLVSMHVRIPQRLLKRLLARRDRLRKTEPMVSVSATLRAVLEEALG
jgi:hypothetical protein